jgi:hypothetical protein
VSPPPPASPTPAHEQHGVGRNRPGPAARCSRSAARCPTDRWRR